MTLKTLNYIYQLLIQEEFTRRSDRIAARKAVADAEKPDALLEAAAKKAYDAWSEAHDALIDFERREW